jgi:two-component system, NarL family, nitrate/nitrite response regulator NarL
LRVLIADDHEPTLDDVRRALEGDEAFDICAVAVDAPQAVQAAVRERPDICLLDVRMPGSGVAAAWEIAARLPNAKIVMLTVSDDDTDLFAALRAGADGYLLKTMNLERLRDALIGVHSGEAAIQRALVARVLKRFHGREPRWRQVISDETPGHRMTSREWQVLELLAQQRSTAEIAEELVLSPSAIRVHIASIVRKFEVADRAALVELFRRTRA